MTCSDVQRVLPEIFDGATEARFQTDFQAHLKSCPNCSDMVSDLTLITSESRQLAETEEPPQRVWVRIAAELRAEGLIRDQEPVPVRPILLPSTQRRRWSALWLAPVAAALLAAGAYVVNHRPTMPVAKQVPATPAPTTSSSPASSPSAPAAVAQAPLVKPAPESAPAPQEVARNTGSSAEVPRTAVEPESSAEDQQFLSAVSTNAPSMRATYENQLQAVNADIRETQAYVDQNPGDVDARQHLMDAYEQKALLYQIALDRIQ
jgi:Putative zinc-finger